MAKENITQISSHGTALQATKPDTKVVRPKRIGVIGISRELPLPPSIGFATLYELIGKNTGNLMFSQAAHSLIDGEVTTIGYSFDPHYVNGNFDAVVIPAANWLNDYSEWDWFIERLSSLKVPVVVMGLGVQCADYELASVRINDSSRRLANFFANQPSPISVRGNFTRDWLASIGISNVVVTGCPSIYMNLFDQSPTDSNAKLIVQGTRYGISNNFLHSKGVNRRMFDFAVDFDWPMIFQSETEEMEILSCPASESSFDDNRISMLLELYKAGSLQAFVRFLRRNGRVFYSLGAWSDFIRGHRGVLGTRLHGSIIALNSGRPAALVPHDSRTAEVAAFAGIQTLHGPTVVACKTADDLENLISPHGLDSYRDTRSSNQLQFLHFLHDANLAPRHDCLF